MQLYEEELGVLSIDLGNSVVLARSSTNLRTRARCQLVHHAPARLTVVRDTAVGIQVFGGDLQIVAGCDQPVAFQQRRQRAALIDTQTLVFDGIDLTQPADRTGAQAAEESIGAATATQLVVVVGGQAR